MLSSRDQRTVDKYLATYAEPEARWGGDQLRKLLQRTWDHVVAIPACGEHHYLPGALQSIVASDSTSKESGVLVIVMLNQRQSGSAEYSVSNTKLRDWFRRNCQCLIEDLNADTSCPQSLYRWRSLDILVIDRSEPPWLFASGEGVGLARKIAADLALLLINAGRVRQPWIHMTDADARVPPDYFVQPGDAVQASENPVSCLLYRYLHVPDPDIEHDGNWPYLVQYELWLRYYVAGLKWAGSPYAFPAIGSLPACHFLAYAQVRGFPKLLAGEDFYLLNKLAKVGEIVLLRGGAVRILSRESDRVPFGTGRGTKKIADLDLSDSGFNVYHPVVFAFLRQFVGVVHESLLAGSAVSSEVVDRVVAALSQFQADLKIDKMNKGDFRGWLHQLVNDLQLEHNITAAIKRAKTPRGAVAQFDGWFDALRTLKLIHRLRDELFGTLPLKAAFRLSPFTRPVEGSATDLELLDGLRRDAVA